MVATTVYILVLRNQKMSKKILSKISYNIYKARDANTKIIYGIFPIYFEVALWYHIVHHITSHHITTLALNPSTMCDHCVVTSNAVGHFSATVRSYLERYIWA